MPTSLTEKTDSRKVVIDKDGNFESAEFVYVLRGVADENSARILATCGRWRRMSRRSMRKGVFPSWGLGRKLGT
jgi:predicted DNA-binding ribbon-helix-helix protein